MDFVHGLLAYRTSLDDQTMEHIDRVFDLDRKNTLWSLGNHDYTDLDRIQKYSHRSSYFVHYHNEICFLVLDTQHDQSNISGDQLKSFKQVIDTLADVSHLIIMTHKLIWMYGQESLESRINEISNGKLGDRFHHINPNNFYTAVYPELVDLESKGIQVICVAGDIGTR